MPQPTLPLGKKDLPSALPLSRMIGPSFIILGLGLGSGEVILWPYLASNYGLGMVWAMLIGITMQFFINMEVERYALVNGESIFVGFARMWRWLPAWFFLSTFIAWVWPGIGLAGASLLSALFGIESARSIGIVVFLLIGCILSIGKVLYRTVETLQKYLISIGVPIIVLLTLYLSSAQDFVELAKGLVGIGKGFSFLPAGIVIGQFLGALAYAGAGGNLNLAQSCYVRDKGYGMGKYADKITSVITAKAGAKNFSLTGNTFPVTQANLGRFRAWWRTTNLEHLLIFWGLGLFTMLTLSLLAYVTAFGKTEAGNIWFVVLEANAIGARTLPVFGMLFLVTTGIMLCATQLTVLDSTSRIMTENTLLLLGKGKKFPVSRVYYIILWSQILFGIGVFSLGFDQPLTLITLGAILNAFTMFSYTGLLLFLNNRMLARELRPSLWRNLALIGTFGFFGIFCILTILEQF